MKIEDLVKSSETLHDFMEGAKQAKVRLSIVEISSAHIEILKAQTDYALVKTHMPGGVVGRSEVLALPYSSPKAGYKICP